MIEAAIGAKTISALYDGTKRYDIVVRFLPEYRNSIDAVKNILVPSSNGALRPMSQRPIFILWKDKPISIDMEASV